MSKIFTSIWLIFSVFSVVSCAVSPKRDISDHFDGTRFFHGEQDYSFADMLKWMLTMNPAKWPKWIEDEKWPPPPEQAGKGELRITHINHATFLIQMDGINILTDPIWSERSSMVSWAGPKRVRAPGVKMADLPRIDIILISHDHYDHLDLVTLKQLVKNHSPEILVGLGIKELLVSQGFTKVTEMDWWQRYESSPNDLKVIFVPSRHSSGRGLFDKNKTLWGGFVIEAPTGNVYFAGDTAYGNFLSDIQQRFGQFRLALLPIGAYEPRWFMKMQHMSPEDAVQAHKLLNIRQSIGMHFGTFGGHNDEEVDAHEKDLKVALKKHDVSEAEFFVLGFGEGIEVKK